jgi:hypothetical protein
MRKLGNQEEKGQAVRRFGRWGQIMAVLENMIQDCYGLLIAQKEATSATALIPNDLIGNILETRKATKETSAYRRIGMVCGCEYNDNDQ